MHLLRTRFCLGITITIAAIAISGVFALHIRARDALSAPPVRQPSVIPTAFVQQVDRTDSQSTLQEPEHSERQVLLYELRPCGFNPRELTTTPGKYLIVLQNRSGKKNLNFRLDRDNGPRLAEKTTPTRDWKAQVILQSGTYILSEASDSSWRSVIHVK
jgi:hypothetical protein